MYISPFNLANQKKDVIKEKKSNENENRLTYSNSSFGKKDKIEEKGNKTNA